MYENYMNYLSRWFLIENHNSYRSYEIRFVKCLKLKRNCSQHFIRKRMNKARFSIKKWNVICVFTSIISRTIERIDFLWQNMHLTLSFQSSHRCFFFVNYEFESRMSFDHVEFAENTIKNRINRFKERKIVFIMKNIWKFAKKHMKKSQQSQIIYADKHRNSTSNY
jgi:hypothetical protein